MPKTDSFTTSVSPITFEIRCGAGGLSAALRRMGFQVFAIDHSANRHSPKVKTFVLDVASDEQFTILLDMFKFCNPCYVHYGLPCGTCSRARERPLPSRLGQSGPPPLRDADHLHGFPSLTGDNAAKVQQANKLYHKALRLLWMCHKHGTLVSIENPARSWLWPLLASMVRDFGDDGFTKWFANLESVYFDACAHGSSRDKRTKLLATQDLFTVLGCDCPGNHIHASWVPFAANGTVVFPTASEAEYPPLLCSRMAEAVQTAVQRHYNLEPAILPRLKDLLKMKLASQSVRHPPLIPEYKQFLHSDVPIEIESHKLLAAPSPTGASTEQPSPGEQPAKRARSMYKYGVWHSPREFLDKAQQISHPMDGPEYIHEVTLKAIERVVDTDPIELAKKRLAEIFRLRQLSNELKDKEAALKATMEPDVAKCVKDKHISLFEYVLQQLGFWDMGVVDLVRRGVPLVGLQEAPPGYRRQLVPATMTEDELCTSALWRRRALMGSTSRMDKEEVEALLESTQAEVDKGFLQGPYSETEMTVLLSDSAWSLNPRFVLFQGAANKVRVIDDAKQSAVNAAYSSTVKLQLQDVDYVAAMTMETMKQAAQRDLPLESWLGKTFDLSKAYKQLAVLPEHRKYAVVGFPVNGNWRFYKSVSLHFGCTGSVYGFVRVSQALWFIMSSLLGTIMSHYFDDFPTIERANGCRVLTLAVSALFDMLGWQHAKVGDKALDFAEAFDVLGVNFNLTQLPQGILTVVNKTSRIDKLCAMLDQVAEEGSLSMAKASEIQGLLNFAVGYFSGRALKHLISAFLPFADQRRRATQKALCDLCAYAKTMLLSAPPRTHSSHDETTPILFFTDGAWEAGVATAGAVVICGAKRVAHVLHVPQALIDKWQTLTGDQVISQIELWALLVIRWHYRKYTLNKRVIAFIDNEAARICAIKATSPSSTMRAMARIFGDLEMFWPCYFWVERVCSFSNPSDLPSRDKLDVALCDYDLTDGGTLEVPNILLEEVLSLLEDSYNPALKLQGAIN